MVDAGTSGYFGQVQSYIRYKTSCRFCRPQEVQDNSLAVCSVRNNPTKNIHCVHYALEVFKGLFSREEDAIFSKYSTNLEKKCK